MCRQLTAGELAGSCQRFLKQLTDSLTDSSRVHCQEGDAALPFQTLDRFLCGFSLLDPVPETDHDQTALANNQRQHFLQVLVETGCLYDQHHNIV